MSADNKPSGVIDILPHRTIEQLFAIGRDIGLKLNILETQLDPGTLTSLLRLLTGLFSVEELGYCAILFVESEPFKD